MADWKGGIYRVTSKESVALLVFLSVRDCNFVSVYLPAVILRVLALRY